MRMRVKLGTVTTRSASREERRRRPWGRYVAVAVSPDGVAGIGDGWTRWLAEHAARADVAAHKARQASTRTSRW